MLHFRTRAKPPPRSSLTRITDGLRFLGACGARTRSIIARRAYAFNHRSTGFERNSIACGTLARDAPKQGLKRRDGEEIAIYLQCIERGRERERGCTRNKLDEGAERKMEQLKSAVGR